MIGEALKKNFTLLHLWLSGILFDFFRLYYLSQIDNEIGDEGAIAIGEALKKNNTLKSLNLCYTGIGYQGTNYILDGLKKNITMKNLNLNSNLYFKFKFQNRK